MPKIRGRLEVLETLTGHAFWDYTPREWDVVEFMKPELGERWCVMITRDDMPEVNGKRLVQPLWTSLVRSFKVEGNDTFVRTRNTIYKLTAHES